jgi:small nuclear ribonucleoprotein (snRNP)-like protein
VCSPDPQLAPTGLEDYLGQRVVIDTRSSYVILGTLTAIARDYLTLADADVHDSLTSSTTKDRYVMDAQRLGVCVNRGEAKVRLADIIAVSPLAGVKTF